MGNPCPDMEQYSFHSLLVLLFSFLLLLYFGFPRLPSEISVGNTLTPSARPFLLSLSSSASRPHLPSDLSFSSHSRLHFVSFSFRSLFHCTSSTSCPCLPSGLSFSSHSLSSAFRPHISSGFLSPIVLSSGPSASLPRLLPQFAFWSLYPLSSASHPRLLTWFIYFSSWILFVSVLAMFSLYLFFLIIVSSQPLLLFCSAHVSVLVCLCLARASLLSAHTISGLDSGSTFLILIS